MPAALPPEPAAAGESLVAGYLPPALVAGLALPNWIGESRRISVVFARMPQVDDAQGVQRLHALVGSAQQVLHRFGGAVHKLAVDDKGMTLVAAMGLPGMSHEHDALRAVRAALAVRAQLEQQGVPTAIGVTTGRAFCGLVGNSRRCEYTIIGDVVNLAARQMQGDGGVLCDEATAVTCAGHWSFERAAPMRVKGTAQAVQVFRPGHGAVPPARSEVPVVGRQQERQLLADALDRVTQRAQEAAVLLIDGEAGMGKSTLVAGLRADALGRGLKVYGAAGDPTESNTPYYPWRALLAGLLGLDAAAGPADQQRRLAQALADEPMLPVLSPLLPHGLQDNAITGGMTDALEAPQQLTPKTASVVGAVFPEAALTDIHPVPQRRAELPDDLERLERQEFIARADPAAMTHAFRHAVLRDAAYSLLLPAQRRSLHQALAQWYVTRPGAAPDAHVYRWKPGRGWQRHAGAPAPSGSRHDRTEPAPWPKAAWTCVLQRSPLTRRPSVRLLPACLPEVATRPGAVRICRGPTAPPRHCPADSDWSTSFEPPSDILRRIEH